ncbi:MAG: hypothetical protein Q8878_02420 [Bacillota bacterium]|nr:hypothetical protein [Bacillota bacterium]
MNREIGSMLPKYVKSALYKIYENGFDAYLVGGCVRDLLSGRRPKDYDIASSALPGEIPAVFEKSYPTGLPYGTVTVIVSGHPVEITTYRRDGVYADGRRPDKVYFSSSILEDLKRRDFTVNAMAWSEKSSVLDPFNGRADLSAKLIRCVGDPLERFSEDPLRIFRAWRFSCTLGFQIERDTKAAALSLKDRLCSVSAERITAELRRMLCAKRTDALYEMINCGLMERFGLKDAPLEILKLSKIKTDAKQRAAVFAVLLERAGSVENASWFLKRMRFDRSTIKLAETAARWKGSLNSGLDIKKAVSGCGKEAAEVIAAVYFIETGENAPLALRSILKSGECMTLSDLKITGNELKRLGAEGEQIGAILEKLLNHVLIFPDDNQTEKLTLIAQQLI